MTAFTMRGGMFGLSHAGVSAMALAGIAANSIAASTKNRNLIATKIIASGCNPFADGNRSTATFPCGAFFVVGQTGFEPATPSPPD